jgi:hypothetical protein
LNSTIGPWNGTVRISASQAPESEEPEGEDDDLRFEPVSVSQRLALGERASLSQSTIYNVEERYFERLTLGLGGELGSADLQLRRSRDLVFDEAYIEEGRSSPWIEIGEEALRPASAQAGISYNVPSLSFWRNRITLDTSVRSNVQANLQRFTESNLSFRAQLDLGIHEFLELSLSSTSQNDFLYRYIPVLAARVEREPRSMLGDLLRSFNFFNREAREESFFNLQTLSLSATHRLGDWDLVISYSGRPELREETSPPEYEWDTELSITVQWRPLPELKSEVTYEDDEVQYETGQ